MKLTSIFCLLLSLAPLHAQERLDADSYNQWKGALKAATATPAGEIRALPGFKVELVRSALAGEGSWIAMAFDAKGRVVISREDKGLFRLTLPTKAGDAAPLEMIENSLLEVRGLLCEGDSIFANANNSRVLVRLRDADGDGTYEERTTLMETPGGVGHGRNQIARHRDGALWAIGGDDVKLPAKFSSVFQNYAEDRLFTAAWDRFHWSNNVVPPCGHVMQLRGEEKTLLCGGLRNPFGIAFNEDGEAFTYDADMEWDVGLPWYRPTRVLHLVSGADYGWRGASRPMPTWLPDAWPAVCDIGKGSPTAIQFGTRSKFPQHWREALFIMDWAYGIIHAVHLTPSGSTYAGRSEVFLQGRPLNVTSLDFGPDGAMYFLTGGRRTQSGIYRVTWTGEHPAPEIRPAPAEAEKARKARHSLEKLHAHGATDSASREEIKIGLASGDLFTRKAARVALDATLRNAPGDHAEWLATSLEAALAVARTGTAAASVFLRKHDWSRLSADERATFLRAFQLSLIRNRKPATKELAEFIESVIPCAQPHAEQLGAELLAFLATPRAVEKILTLLEKSTTQEERLHYLFTLRHAKTGWTLEQRKSWLAAFRREAARAVGAHHLGVTFRYARADFEATLTADEKTALAEDLAALDPATVSLPAAAPRQFVKSWTQAELEPHLVSVAAPERDLKRGRELFTAQCATCHRYGPQGGVIGPDLTGIAGRFDRRTVLESLLDPWRVVADPYRIATASMKSGEIIAGRVTGDDATTIFVEVNPVDPDASRKVRRSEATNITFTSAMPLGLANTFTREELLDLMAYMERGAPK